MHQPTEAVHADEREWETLRWPGQWSKMLFHPGADDGQAADLRRPLQHAGAPARSPRRTSSADPPQLLSPLTLPSPLRRGRG